MRSGQAPRRLSACKGRAIAFGAATLLLSRAGGWMQPAVSGDAAAAVGGSAAPSGLHLAARVVCLCSFMTMKLVNRARSRTFTIWERDKIKLQGSVTSGGRLRRRLWLAVD